LAQQASEHGDYESGDKPDTPGEEELDETEKEQAKNFLGRTILTVQKILDANEMQDGGITKIEQL
jgi:hypothetical protein